MTTELPIAQGLVDVLVGRLRTHADPGTAKGRRW